ncbi:MAG: hypothetical protein J6Q89_00090 [Clostridia bacterium]|nr:hypothetical protein [Clostridia bacterium]
MKIKNLLVFILACLMMVGSFAACDSSTDESSLIESEIEESSEISEEENMYPEYWGKNEYNRTENVGAPEIIDSHEMTVKRVKASKYEITYQTDAGKMTVTLDEKTWGTFNIGMYKLVDDKGNTHVFTGGSTDWEYVYRTKKTATAPMVWSGGNHGNETLVSLKFYNGETNEEIVFSKDGESVTVNKLHVLETTKLLFVADSDGDGYGYKNKDKDKFTDDDVYANVVRKYTFVGPQITLNVDYEYIKEVYYQLSYTCMFPIEKKYGLYCDMIDVSGNKVKTITTKKVGSPNYDGPMNSGNAATRVLIYGDEMPIYKFDVQVTTHTDSLENQKNSFKTAFWDMNTNSNKLYFSKYDQNNVTKIEVGTKYNTECVWTFIYDKDAK